MLGTYETVPVGAAKDAGAVPVQTALVTAC